MLVDIFCDELIFSAQQGSEMKTIFLEALSKYSVNENRMWKLRRFLPNRRFDDF